MLQGIKEQGYKGLRYTFSPEAIGEGVFNGTGEPGHVFSIVSGSLEAAKELAWNVRGRTWRGER